MHSTQRGNSAKIKGMKIYQKYLLRQQGESDREEIRVAVLDPGSSGSAAQYPDCRRCKSTASGQRQIVSLCATTYKQVHQTMHNLYIRLNVVKALCNQ